MRYIRSQNVIVHKDAIPNIELLFDGEEDSVSKDHMCWFGNAFLAIEIVSLREWDDPDKVNEITECIGSMPMSRGLPPIT